MRRCSPHLLRAVIRVTKGITGGKMRCAMGYQHDFRSDGYSFKRFKPGRAEVVMLGYSFIVRKPEQTPL